MNPLTYIIAICAAGAAIATSATPVAPSFADDVIGHCAPIVQPGVFIGCNGAPNADGGNYAGTVWISYDDGATFEPVPQVGP